MQWSIHDVFHIDLLTPYHETKLHGANYSRPPPDLVDDQEEYEVKKILDSWHHGKKHTLQYLVKWKGYPDSDNEWVGHKDVHAPEAIREFENSRTALNTYMRAGMTSKYPILPFTLKQMTTHSSHMSNAINSYYHGSPEHIFGAELNSQLITQDEAQELCAKKYIQPHVKDKNELATPLTEEELARVQEVFPDLQMQPVSQHPLSPILRCMSDPDGMGATPTHQANTQTLDNELWEAEGVLRIPPHMEGAAGTVTEEDQHAMEGGAVCTSHVQEKHCEGSAGSTAPASTPATKEPWSCTTSLKDWYPDEHPFIMNHHESNDLNKTPYTLTTNRYPLYKRSYMPTVMQKRKPLGFNSNHRAHYINYPIRLPHEMTTQQAHYMQAIMAPNPLVVVLCKDSDKVFSKPLYTLPVYRFDGKPTYATRELDHLKADAQGREMTDRMLDRVGDLLLKAEVHFFHMVTAELERMETVLVENEEAWGQLASAKLGVIRQLEMADAIERINLRNDGFVDDALHVHEELLHGRKG